MDEPSDTAAGDDWLDLVEAAALIDRSTHELERLISAGALPARPSPHGRAGVLKSELLAWQQRDAMERRGLLMAFARDIDREIFG